MTVPYFLVGGVGFFNDAYDLLVMNVVNVILTEQYGSTVYNKDMKSNASAAAIVGAIFGQLFFGFMGDRLGRKLNMIISCVILIVGGILCTVAYGGSPTGTLWFLIIARGILGFGIGGEYPLAASSTAEDATDVRSRNSRVATVFSMQGVGFLTSAIAGNLLVEVFASGPKGSYDPTRLEIIWRLLFGLGIIPAVFILFFRWNAEEPGAYQQARETQLTTSVHKSFARMLFIFRYYAKGLLGTAGTWFLFDIVFYALNLFQASILSVVGIKDASLVTVTTQNVLVSLLALPGYIVAVCYINKMGRKNMQLMGFTMMTIIFILLGALWNEVKKSPVGFVLLYGASYFFSNFGPNTSTFIFPTEMFPTPIRATCHGFSAAMGKVGAAIGAFGFVKWVDADGFGYAGTFYTFAVICAISIPLTWWCCFDNPDSLDELDREFAERIQAADDFTRQSFKEEDDGLSLNTAKNAMPQSAFQSGPTTPAGKV